VRRIHRGALAMGITVLCPPTRLVLKEFGLESLEMTVRDPNGVLLNFIQNVRGGIGPENRFPGIAGRRKAPRPRAGASRSRVPVQGRTALKKTARKSAKKTAPGPKPGKLRKPRSGGSPGRRSG
jgi:hypothetical protein